MPIDRAVAMFSGFVVLQSPELSIQLLQWLYRTRHCIKWYHRRWLTSCKVTSLEVDAAAPTTNLRTTSSDVLPDQAESCSEDIIFSDFPAFRPYMPALASVPRSIIVSHQVHFDCSSLIWINPLHLRRRTLHLR